MKSRTQDSLEQSKYWKKWRAGVPCRHYSRAKRNNDLRFGARMNYRHTSELRGQYRRFLKGKIRQHRLIIDHQNEVQRQLRLSLGYSR